MTTYISNNPELRQAIKDLYNHKIQPYELADIYYKNQLYSAASTYYNWEIYDLHNCLKIDFQKKSYCFLQLAKCYYNQQKDHHFSNWQLSMIYDMCQEAISYDPQNYQAILLIGLCQIKLERYKEAYFTYNKFILNLDKYTIQREDYHEIYNLFLVFFDLCEKFYIIKYEYIYKIMMSFVCNCEELNNFNMINKLHARYQNHLKQVQPDEINIIKGNYF